MLSVRDLLLVHCQPSCPNLLWASLSSFSWWGFSCLEEAFSVSVVSSPSRGNTRNGAMSSEVIKLSAVDLIKTDQNNKIFPGWGCFQVPKDVLGSQGIESRVPVIPYHRMRLDKPSQWSDHKVTWEWMDSAKQKDSKRSCL
ncbi:hypothetical protein DV515_00012723 [Chloebia gouldiae]|uniref:Uncharacterized protein n=1 Tax=Chloebia gouldiae TaxID=44316 RepID=A0A3L8S2V9_CHLGU|nr:hypothetical protein DV515_00012723 [Chloebia gouldiae]